MKIEIDAYQLLINKRLSENEVYNCKKIIEKTGMDGNIPRPIIPLKAHNNLDQTIISIVGNVGNYHDAIISAVNEEFNVTSQFIDDKQAQKILDDIDNNFLEYL